MIMLMFFEEQGKSNKQLDTQRTAKKYQENEPRLIPYNEFAFACEFISVVKSRTILRGRTDLYLLLLKM